MTATRVAQRSGLLRLNGADLYHEVRGSGPTVLFIQAMIEEGMARAGAAGAMENFLRHYATEEVFGSLTQEQQQRAVRSAEVFLTIELEPMETHSPDIEAITSSGVPVVVLKGADSERYADIPEAVAWLSDKLGVPVSEAPGAHAGYWQYPDEWARMLRPILVGMSRREER